MTEWLILRTASFAVGFIIDCFVGDPYCIPHPVVGIGKCISFFDKKLRRGDSNPKDVSRGRITVALVAIISVTVPALLLLIARMLHPAAYFIVNSIVNYIPARISGLLMVITAPVVGLDGKNAWYIFRRDRYKHASPNSAQTESACAGALGLRLAEDAVYGGVVHKKEYIGDGLREIEPKDITRAARLMYAASVLMLVIGLLLLTVVIVCL